MASLRAVYDCNIFVQALINPNGPAARCVEVARKGDVVLFVSPFVLSEIREIHEKLPEKYGVTANQTDELARYIVSFSTIITDFSHKYQHPFDPDDSHYVNLATSAAATLIVSRDRHLLNLMDSSRTEAQTFQQQFPSLSILDPVAFLRLIDEQSAGNPIE